MIVIGLFTCFIREQYTANTTFTLSLHREGVLEIGHLVVSLFRRCITLYIGETGRRLGDRFREHLCDVEKDDKDALKSIARHFNLPNHSMQHMAVWGISLHQGNTESRKTLEQKFIFQIGTLNPNGINERFSFN